MDPSRAAKELLERLGDGLHVLRTHSPSYIKFRRNREDMRELFTALVLLTEGLRQGVQATELQGWYPELHVGPEYGLHKDDILLGWEGGRLVFNLTPEGILYSYNEGPLGTVTRMVGESLAEAAVRMVFQMLEPIYTPGLFSGSHSV